MKANIEQHITITMSREEAQEIYDDLKEDCPEGQFLAKTLDEFLTGENDAEHEWED